MGKRELSYDELSKMVNESYKKTGDIRETVKETGVPPWFGPEARAIVLDAEFWHLLRAGWSLYSKM